MRKKPTLLGIIIVILVVMSVAVIIWGVTVLLSVRDGISQGVSEAWEAIENVAYRSENTVTVQGRKSYVNEGVGILTFRLDLDYEVGVFEGTGDYSLERGAGHHTTSAALNTVGNCVIFGHRDSAFKHIKTLSVGDKLMLESYDSVYEYKVEDIYVADPSDLSIFEDSDRMRLTLVTCYPFTFVGPAPQRCVVVAYAIEK